jgi:hypothetical protein
MHMAKQQERQATLEQDKSNAHDAVIAEQVLHALGRPTDLLQVQVRNLWQKHYRVNILVGPDIASMRILHSYFLVADSEGNIATSTPAIVKRY